MSRNGSGTYTLPAGNPVVTSTTIASTWANNTMTDLATALTGSLASDGQTTATGNLKMGANRITGLADGIAATDAATVSQVTASTAGLGTMSTQNANNVAITGGAISGTTASFTTFTASGTASFTSTGAVKIPAGTTAQQPTPTTGMIRYNSTNSQFEGYFASAWGSLGTGAAGSNTQVQYNSSGVLAGSSALTFNGTTLTVPKIAFASSNTPSLTNYQGGAVTSGTAVASTSGTSIDFTSIPSWVKRITVMLNGVSTSGGSNLRFQVGSGSMTTSNYSGASIGVTAGQSTSGTNGTTLSGLDVYVYNQGTTYAFYGNVVWTLIDSNTWTCAGTVATSQSTSIGFIGGASPSLSGALDRIRLTTANGTDTFDAGSINILYE